MSEAFPYNETLYTTIRTFIEDHLDLVEEAQYDILTAKVFECYLIEHFDTTGYIYFLGPPRSGKTRALEVICALMTDALLGITMSAPAIYRTLDKNPGRPLFLDEVQQYLDDDKTTFLAILNGGQRRGQKAWLVVRTEDGWDAKDFDVFGPKFLASTEETRKSLATRCITMSMVKNARRVPLRIDETRAQAIRIALYKYKNDTLQTPPPDLEQTFIDLDFADYRNIEAFINLAAVTPPEHRNTILEYAKELDDYIAEEEGINFYAELFQAVHQAYKTATKGKISIQAVADIYNGKDIEVRNGMEIPSYSRPDQEILDNKTIGRQLNIMGLNRKCRMTGGRIGRHISEKLMKRLTKRYSTRKHQLKLNSEVSERSEGTLCTTLSVPPSLEGFMPASS